jgi:hypothetical protein
VEHNLFGKMGSIFPDHALALRKLKKLIGRICLLAQSASFSCP